MKYVAVFKFWNFIAKNKLQINSRDKSRDAFHATFKKIYLKKYFQKLTSNKCASIVS